jgi:hypothetical protein
MDRAHFVRHKVLAEACGPRRVRRDPGIARKAVATYYRTSNSFLGKDRVGSESVAHSPQQFPATALFHPRMGDPRHLCLRPSRGAIAID